MTSPARGWMKAESTCRQNLDISKIVTTKTYSLMALHAASFTAVSVSPDMRISIEAETACSIAWVGRVGAKVAAKTNALPCMYGASVRVSPVI